MTYDILIQPQPGGAYRATVLGWPELSAVGNSEQTVIERIGQTIRERLRQGKLVRIEVNDDTIKTATVEHPWLDFLGMWKDDPTFDDLLDKMATYCRELDETSETSV